MDGFKCYRNKTLIKPIDPKFTAITGMNGSGKSNIIDAIVFALDLTSSKILRVTCLKELINIHRKECAVNLLFNNKNKSRSPPGYEHADVIEISRMLDSEGKSHYRLNRHNCTKKTIDKLSKSIGISNDFVIMQGHITKVINMKNKELMSMIEEAAGTKSYIIEKDRALEILQKKENKLKEIQQHLQKNVSPFLTELLNEKKIYEQNREFEKRRDEMKRELEECRRRLSRSEMCKDINELEKSINDYIRDHDELARLESTLEARRKAEGGTNIFDLRSKINSENLVIEGVSLDEIEMKLQEKIREYDEICKVDIKNEGIEDMNKMELIEKESILVKEMSNSLGYSKIGEIEKLKEELGKLERSLEEKHYKIEEELGQNDGRNNAWRMLTVEILGWLRDEKRLRDLKRNRDVLNSLITENGKRKKIKGEMETQCNRLKSKINYPFIPGVYGTIDENMEIKNAKYKEAISIIMGGRGKFVICKDEDVACELLKKSARKISCIPLNKIVVKENAVYGVKEMRGLDLIEYDRRYENAYKYIFGDKYVFEDKEKARKACFEKKLVCVTLEGNVYDPRGTVTGGAVRYKDEVIRRSEILRLEEEIVNMEVMDRVSEEEVKGVCRLVEEAVVCAEEIYGMKGRIELLEGMCNASVDVSKKLEEVRSNLEMIRSSEREIAEREKRRKFLSKEIDEIKEEKNRSIRVLERAKSNYEECRKLIEEAMVMTRMAEGSESVERMEKRRGSLIKSQLKRKNVILKLSEKMKGGGASKDETRLKDGNEPIEFKMSERFTAVLNEFGINEDILIGTREEVSEEEKRSLEERIIRLKGEFGKKREVGRMDPSNFEMLEKNMAEICELERKIVKLEDDKLKIRRSIERLMKLGIEENRKAFEEINRNLRKFFNYFDSSLDVRITDGFEIRVGDKSLSELSGGQRSLIALSLIFSMLSHRPAPFYIFDEIDSALDINYTQGIGEIIKNEFNTAQFIIISLKNNMFEQANKIFKVVLQDQVPKIF